MSLTTPTTIRALQREFYDKAKPKDLCACLGVKQIGNPCAGRLYALA